MKKTFIISVFLGFAAMCMMMACNGKVENTKDAQEDAAAKQNLQGIWIDEDDGGLAFRIVGDTIYYPDNSSEAAAFHVTNDTLYISTSHPNAYAIKLLTGNSFRFINSEGDEAKLVRTEGKEYLARFSKDAGTEGADGENVTINQKVTIKRDSIMTAGEKRYHAYVQVNPTSYKVLIQHPNSDGVMVDQAYFDNIVHIAVYEGASKLFSRDFKKTDFAKNVPEGYLERSILSDILFSKATAEGVVFEAIIAEPEASATYRIFITISNDGKISTSV